MDADPFLTDDDSAFLAAFESGSVPNSAFHHRDHIRLAWLYLRRDGPEAGARNVSNAILRFATAHGAAGRFHVSMTTFWVRLVQHVMSTVPGMRTFDELMCAFPLLADKQAVYRHYSRDLLNSPAARQTWLAPDLRPLP
jgi:hypothetical protein